MGRRPCCEKVGLKKGSWTPEEDHKLVTYVEQHGHGGWRALPSKADGQRLQITCPKGQITKSRITGTHIKKRLVKMGIDPISHKRRIAAFGIDTTKNVANLSHMAQWENARLEAEARLMSETNKLVTGPNQEVQKKTSAQLVDKPTLSRLIPPQPLCLDVLKAWQGIISCNVSNRITLESPTSTLNFSNDTSTIPKVGFVDNQCTPMVNDVTGMRDEGLIMGQNFRNDPKFAESSIITQAITEMMENSIELHEMVYPSSVFPINKEDFTELFDVTNTNNLTMNNNVDLEEDWNNILNNLAYSSPPGSVCFLN